MEINIRITNAFTQAVEFNSTDSIAESSIDAAHKLYTEAYPNSFVNFAWGEEGNKAFICGAPHNMMQDEIAHSEGRMTWDEYFQKWYNKK